MGTMKHRMLMRLVAYLVTATISLPVEPMGMVFASDQQNSSLAPRSQLKSIRGALRKKKHVKLVVTDKPAIKKVWKRMVDENVRLFQFTHKLRNLTRRNGSFINFPQTDLDALKAIVDFRTTDDLGLRYYVCFILHNFYAADIRGEKIEYLARKEYQLFMVNLAFLVAAARTRVSMEEVRDALAFIIISGTLAESLGKKSDFFQQIGMGIFAKEITPRLPVKPSEQHLLVREFKRLFMRIYAQKKVSFFEATRNKYDTNIPPRILLKRGYRKHFDIQFLLRPRQYIELQPKIKELEPWFDHDRTRLDDVARMVFDSPVLPLESQGKVRKFKLKNGQEVYAKRVNPLRTKYPEEEIEIAERINLQLQAKNSRFHAQEFIGIVYDEGAFYLLSLAVPTGRPVAKQDAAEAEQIEKILQDDGTVDVGAVRQKDILAWYSTTGERHYTVLDFESHPYSIPAGQRLINDFHRKFDRLTGKC